MAGKKKAHGVKVGDTVIFKAYSDLAPDQDEIFKTGDKLTVISASDDGKLVVQNADEQQDTVFFPEEVGKEGGKGKTKSTAKKAAVKEAKVVVLVDTPAVRRLLKKHGAIDAADQLMAQSEQTYFILGGVLAHIKDEKLHEKLGFEGTDGFNAYVEGHLGTAYRKCVYLINIYTYFSGLGLDETRLAAIGWSKAKELIGNLTPENMDEMLRFAEDNSRNELIEHVKTSKVNEGKGTKSSKATKVKYTFNVFADQAEVVARAIKSAQEQTGDDDAGKAILHIITEWAMVGDSGVATTLDEDILYLNSKHNVALEVIAPDATAEDGAAQQTTAS